MNGRGDGKEQNAAAIWNLDEFRLSGERCRNQDTVDACRALYGGAWWLLLLATRNYWKAIIDHNRTNRSNSADDDGGHA